MKILFLISLYLFLSSINLFSSTDLISRCFEPSESDPLLYGNDFKWNQTDDEMKALFEKLYNSDKRLYKRAYYKAQNDTFYIPIEVPVLNTFKNIEISKNFIRNITKHVENALERKYADYIFFSDMGHSHFYFPEKIYKEKFYKFDDDKRHLLYKAFTLEPTLRVLYHTAEQLKMIQGQSVHSELIYEKHVLWRYFTRNIVGDNIDGNTLEIYYTGHDDFNTIRQIDGYSSWSAGFNISANQNGCFPYKHNGKTYYFDLSFEDLPYSSGKNDIINPFGKVPRL